MIDYIVEDSKRGKNQEEEGEEKDSQPQFLRFIPSEHPPCRHQDGRAECQIIEQPPLFEICQRKYSDIEQRDVGKQPGLVITTGRKHNRSEESADQSEDRNRQRIMPCSEQDSKRGNGRHVDKSDSLSNHLIEGEGRKEG